MGRVRTGLKRVAVSGTVFRLSSRLWASAPRPRVASSHISLLVPTFRPEVRVSTMHRAVASI
eukprot:6135340-Prymnesium_polylepis.1